MKSVWTGHLEFGMVLMPVSLFKATEDHDVGFHTYCPVCQGAMGQYRACKVCAHQPEYSEILRGTEVDTPDGKKLVFVTDEEKDQLAGTIEKKIAVMQFAEADEIDPIMYNGSYFVGSEKGAKAYSLLAQVLTESNWVAIGSFALRTKIQRAVIRVREDGKLMLHPLLWPDEVRKPDGVAGSTGKYSDAELKMARTVVESMLEPFDPAAHVDIYQEKLRELIACKATGAKFVVEPAKNLDDTTDDDMLKKLEASIKRHPAGKRRGAAKRRSA